MREFTRAKHNERAGALAIVALAAVLLFVRLGSPYLWQDEAQTALIAGTILDHGLPHGTDGTNFFSQEQGVEYGDGYIWRWHTWLSFYLVAGSFALFGSDTATARLPFALFGLATVMLSFATARTLWDNRRAAYLAAAGLALCVPFLLLSRQARWYSVVAFLSLLGLYAYSRLGHPGRASRFSLFGAAFLLFHTHYLYCATLLATLLLHSALFERARFRSVLGVSALVTAMNAPWIIWLAGIDLGDGYSGRLLDFSRSLTSSRIFGARFLQEFFDPLFLLVPAAIAIDRWRCGERPLEIDARARNNVALLALFCAVTIVALGFLAPGNYFRYLAPLAPVALLLLGLLVASLMDRSRIAGAAVIVLWLVASPIRQFAYELTHDFDGPVEGIVTFLERMARPGDTVAITYGDLPLKFYTDLRVIGGLTGEDLAEVKTADWIIPRRSIGSREERRVVQVLRNELTPRRYRGFEIPYPDTQFENREDPAMHRYRTERPTYPRVRIYGAIR